MHHSLLLFGLSGSGKSSLIAAMIEALAKSGSHQADVITAEHYTAYSDVVGQGLARVWPVRTRQHPFETLRQAVRGYWPENPLDPNSKLLPPPSGAAPRIRVFEGIGTFGQYLSSNHHEGGLLKRAGEGDIIGPVQEHVQFKDGAEGVGGLCWAHYSIGQMELMGLVQSSQKFPGLTIWTSHEDDGKQNGQPFIGPQVFGNKMTGVIAKEFDNLWHMAVVPKDVPMGKGETTRILERRIYMKEHFLPNGPVPYKSKNSALLKDQDKIKDYVSLSDKNGLATLGDFMKLLPTLNVKF